MISPFPDDGDATGAVRHELLWGSLALAFGVIFLIVVTGVFSGDGDPPPVETAKPDPAHADVPRPAPPRQPRIRHDPGGMPDVERPESGDPPVAPSPASEDRPPPTDADVELLSLARHFMAWEEALVTISRRGGAEAVAAALDAWSERSERHSDAAAEQSESSLRFARSTAYFAIGDHDVAAEHLLAGVLALEPDPAALAVDVDASVPWSFSPQIVPLFNERDGRRRSIGTGASFASQYIAGTRLVHPPATDRTRYSEWLEELWRDETRPELAMAASIWAHLLAYERSLMWHDYAPALVDERDGVTGELTPPTRSPCAELLRWSLRRHVVGRFAEADSAAARRLREIALKLSGAIE